MSTGCWETEDCRCDSCLAACEQVFGGEERIRCTTCGYRHFGDESCEAVTEAELEASRVRVLRAARERIQGGAL